MCIYFIEQTESRYLGIGEGRRLGLDLRWLFYYKRERERERGRLQRGKESSKVFFFFSSFFFLLLFKLCVVMAIPPFLFTPIACLLLQVKGSVFYCATRNMFLRCTQIYSRSIDTIVFTKAYLISRAANLPFLLFSFTAINNKKLIM